MQKVKPRPQQLDYDQGKGSAADGLQPHRDIDFTRIVNTWQAPPAVDPSTN